MNPRGNVLVVHVVSARNLHIRSQKALDVYVSLSISGKGPWKSKVTTNTMRVESDSNARGEPIRWDEHCEFQLNDMDTKLVVRLNHKTMLGTTETLGELCLALESMARFQTPVWFVLGKPGGGGGSGNGGERGQIQLGYQFTMSTQATTSASGMPAMSVSNMSLNKIEKEKKFDRLRRKVQQFGRRGSTSSKRASVLDDSQSLASVSIGGADFLGGNSRRSSSLSSTTNSAALAFSSPTPSEQQQQNLTNTKTDVHQPYAYGLQSAAAHHRPQEDTFSIHSSATADFDTHQPPHQPKQLSAIPSSFSNVVFGSARSARLGGTASTLPVIAPPIAMPQKHQQNQQQQQQRSYPQQQAITAEASTTPNNNSNNHSVVAVVPPGDHRHERRNSVVSIGSSIASSSVNNMPPPPQQQQHLATTIAVDAEPSAATGNNQQRNLKAKVRHKAEQLLMLRGGSGAHSGHNKKQQQQLQQPQVTIDDCDSHRGAVAGTHRHSSSRRGSMESSSGFASLGSGQLGTLNENTSPEYLLNVIKHLRAELLKKEERIRDMEEYTDKLINKVMVANPELLQASPPKPNLLTRR